MEWEFQMALSPTPPSGWFVAETRSSAYPTPRHALTPALLREGGHIGYGIRPAYRRQGLGIAILRNGGILESEEYVADRGEVVQRYWIAPASIDCAV